MSSQIPFRERFRRWAWKFVVTVPPLVALLAIATAYALYDYGKRERAAREGQFGTLLQRMETQDAELRTLRTQLASLASLPRVDVTRTPPPVSPTVVPLTTAGSTTTTATSAVTSTMPPPEPLKTQAPLTTIVTRELELSVKECRIARTTLRCDLQVMNQSAMQRKFEIGIGGHYDEFGSRRGSAWYLDDRGNEYRAIGGNVGNRNVGTCESSSACSIERVIAPTIVTPMSLRFDGVAPDAQRATVLRLKWRADDGEWYASDFRDVPITR
ncbi:MAG TPA: hypothetical protein VF618_25000 [Thermoanaerobaculia bacterium]